MAYKRTSPMPIIEGGTNAITMATTYGVNYFDGSKIVTTAVGSAGEGLTSNGAGVAPTFQAVTPTHKSMLGAGGTAGIIASAIADFYTAPFYDLGAALPSGANIQFVAVASGTLRNLYVRPYNNASTTDVSFTVNINSVNTAITTTVTALSTAVFSDTTHSVAVNQGDLIQFQAQQATTGQIKGVISVQFES